MLWINSKHTCWQAACSKSLLMVFIVQILLSAACISTANADTLSQHASAKAHCQNQLMASDMAHASDGPHGMSSCGHCDIPEMALSAPVSINMDMTAVLLAIIVLPELPVLSSSNRAVAIEQRAPPHTSSLLHHTNQRILI